MAPQAWARSNTGMPASSAALISGFPSWTAAVGPLHAFRPVADDHRDAQLSQVEHGGALPLVGAGDLHPCPVEHLRQGRHGHPADAHQVGPLPRL